MYRSDGLLKARRPEKNTEPDMSSIDSGISLAKSSMLAMATPPGRRLVERSK